MYNLFYNLNDRPFNQKPDLKYFIATRPHKRSIVHMRVGFEQQDGLLVLTGEKGIGKTTLVTHMLDQLDKNNNIIAFIEKPPLKDHDFLPAILTSLQIPVTDNQPKVLFSALHKFMLAQARLNKRMMLVIDNAEGLSNNCLELIRLMSAARLDERGLLQIILVGTTKLEETLSAKENQAIKEQISISTCIHPLQVSDTREYILHRLYVAEWNGDPIIDEDAFDAIHQLTEGVPSEINRYCDKLFMMGMMYKTHHIGKNDVFNLTEETMTKLDEFEAAQFDDVKQAQDDPNGSPDVFFEQPEPTRTKQPKAAPAQQSVSGIDVENFVFDTPAKTSNSFLNRQTMMTIAGAFLVSSLSIFIFDKMSGDNPVNPFTKTSLSHGESNNPVAHATATSHSNSSTGSHSSTNTHGSANSHGSANTHGSAASHQNGSQTVEYVLNEMPSEPGAHGKPGGHVPEIELLDIQALLMNSSEPNAEHSSHSGKRQVSEVVSNASAASF